MRKLFVLLLLTGQSLFAQHSLETIWTSDKMLKFGEGIVPSPDGKFLFVSNTIGNPMGRDGDGTVSKVGFDGKMIQFDWVKGMNAPKDIQIYKNTMYAADLNEVVVIDIPSATIKEKIKIEGAGLLHNFAIDENGVVYVSEMFGGKIYKIKDGQYSLYLDNCPGAAGLLAENGFLWVLTGGKLLKVDKDKNRTVVSEGMNERMNGLARINESEYVVTCWSGMMYYVNADGSNEVLLDTRDQNIPCGIVYYDKAKNILYMTTDQNDYMVAYRIVKK
ncbi:hypothetical protein [Jiulongibacter sp. NS-SX5]|uniref:hypothetical protein n=1 Tax=Jiulongibacter sp. NS-SX5 TaxID=3463854 RepID=UPI004059D26A